MNGRIKRTPQEEYIDRLLTLKNNAIKADEQLKEGRIFPHTIPSVIRRIDFYYDSIIREVGNWGALHALFSFDKEAFYRDASNGFNVFLTRDRTWAEADAMSKVNNSFPGGILHEFKHYAHHKMQYMQRVKAYLEHLDQQLNGNGKEEISFQRRVQISSSKQIAELRELVKNWEKLGDVALLDLFDSVRRKINTGCLAEDSKPIAAFFAAQKNFLDEFGYAGQLAPKPRRAFR